MFRVLLIFLMISCQNQEITNIPTFQPLQNNGSDDSAKKDPYDFEKGTSLKEDKEESCADEEEDYENFDPMKPKKRSGCKVQ